MYTTSLFEAAVPRGTCLKRIILHGHYVSAGIGYNIVDGKPGGTSILWNKKGKAYTRQMVPGNLPKKINLPGQVEVITFNGFIYIRNANFDMAF